MESNAGTSGKMNTNRSFDNSSRNVVDASTISSHLTSGSKMKTAFLATAWVIVSGKSTRIKVRALLDQGSTNTLISSKLANSLNTKQFDFEASLNGIGDITAGHVCKAMKIHISAIDCSSRSVYTNALIVSSLTSYTPKFKFLVNEFSYLNNLNLADPNPSSDDPIDLIIGADIYAYILRFGLKRGNFQQPVAQKTIFGWVLSGNFQKSSENKSLQGFSHLSHSTSYLESLLQRFWETEEVTRYYPQQEDEAKCESHFCDTHSRDSLGRYIVRIPFKFEQPLPLGDSKIKTDKLLFGLERRLERKPIERKMYEDFMREYETLGHMSIIESEHEDDKMKMYLSHHPVFKESSSTTKLRVVFNASAKTSNGISINDLQLIGPKLQNDLPSLITRWRSWKFVLCTDIAQMYRQIWIHPDDRNLQRIRWRYSPSQSINSYTLNAVTFGMASAPFLAQRVIKQLANDEGDNFPLAIPVALNNFYVDDCLFGADDVFLARQIRDQIISLMEKGGFYLRKWPSNCPDLIDDLSISNHGLAFDHTIQNTESLSVLGITWCPCKDQFSIDIKIPEIMPNSKRSILSTIAQCYDPLGWLSPTIIVAKIFMQKLWQLKIEWDLPIPENLKSQWIYFIKELPLLKELEIPRWIKMGSENRILELHGFADASEKAIAAVIYLRTESLEKIVDISLLMSKTRVSPLKRVTIPRLELCAAVLLAELMHSIVSLSEFQNVETYFWTDSTVVIAWLERQSSTWKTYVANRVSVIHTLFPNAQWRHVPGEVNSADVATRGRSPRELLNCSLWWHGPHWLIHSDEWPSDKPEILENALLEMRVISNVSNLTESSVLKFAEKFSSWKTLLHVISYLFRWRKRRNNQLNSLELSFDEVEFSFLRIIYLLQRCQFRDDIRQLESNNSVLPNSSIVSLNPFIDGNGFLRVGGRLENTSLNYDTKHLYILRSHYIIRLFVRYVQHFWKLWSQDYLQSLQVRSKWRLKTTPISVGQIVLLKHDSLPPTRWKLGRVIELHPGSDGIVRVVSIRTSDKVLRRPVVKLLPVTCDTDLS